MFRCGWAWKVWLGVGRCEWERTGVGGSEQVWAGVDNCAWECAGVVKSEQM